MHIANFIAMLIAAFIGAWLGCKFSDFIDWFRGL
jgi:hypothetical protein